jgi:hypothetical protein
MKSTEEAGCCGCSTGGVVRRTRRLVLVTSGFEEIKEILPRDVFKNEDEEGRRLEGAMECDNVRVNR